MKILFLDIDGVMNYHKLLLAEGIDAISEPALDLLKMIVFATDAKIVLSSTWRLWEDARATVRKRLGTRGMDFIDVTKELRIKFSRSAPRADEIKEWLERHPEVTNFAILDDDPDAGLEELAGHFFQTSFDHGLTPVIAEKVINHLRGETANNMSEKCENEVE